MTRTLAQLPSLGPNYRYGGDGGSSLPGVSSSGALSDTARSTASATQEDASR